MDGYQRMARVMKAMGHPIRLQILEALSLEEEACVCHLEHHLEQRQAYISQQLARLRDAGLVVDRKDGLNVYYSLAQRSFAHLMNEAKKVVSALAHTRGEKLIFQQSMTAPSDRCPCPRCQVDVPVM